MPDTQPKFLSGVESFLKDPGASVRGVFEKAITPQAAPEDKAAVRDQLSRGAQTAISHGKDPNDPAVRKSIVQATMQTKYQPTFYNVTEPAAFQKQYLTQIGELRDTLGIEKEAAEAEESYANLMTASKAMDAGMPTVDDMNEELSNLMSQRYRSRSELMAKYSEPSFAGMSPADKQKLINQEDERISGEINGLINLRDAVERKEKKARTDSYNRILDEYKLAQSELDSAQKAFQEGKADIRYLLDKTVSLEQKQKALNDSGGVPNYLATAGSGVPSSTFNDYIRSTGIGKTSEQAGIGTSPYHVGTYQKAVDIPGKTTDPVNAFIGGRIIEVTEDHPSGWGNTIVVEDDQGIRWRYAHMGRMRDYEVGASVYAGDEIGKMGATGTTIGPTGVHLHLHAFNSRTGEIVDPFFYQAIEGTAGEGEKGILDDVLVALGLKTPTAKAAEGEFAFGEHFQEYYETGKIPPVVSKAAEKDAFKSAYKTWYEGKYGDWPGWDEAFQEQREEAAAEVKESKEVLDALLADEKFLKSLRKLQEKKPEATFRLELKTKIKDIYKQTLSDADLDTLITRISQI